MEPLKSLSERTLQKKLDAQIFGKLDDMAEDAITADVKIGRKDDSGTIAYVFIEALTKVGVIAEVVKESEDEMTVRIQAPESNK